MEARKLRELYRLYERTARSVEATAGLAEAGDEDAQQQFEIQVQECRRMQRALWSGIDAAWRPAATGPRCRPRTS